ncbi:hypothetical protein ABFS83_04G147100 [Erythranthe nasuta]
MRVFVELNQHKEISHCDVNNESMRQEKKIVLPNLNVVAADFVDNPNVDLYSPENEIFLVDRSLLDLNRESFVEHDISLEMGLQTFIDDNLEDIPSATRKVKHLNNEERRAIYNVLQHKSINGSLKKGVRKMVASQFSHKKTRNCGRKRIEINMDQFRGIPLHRRTTLESLACSLNMAKSTLLRRLKSRELRRHSNAIKPFVTEKNKRSRLQFCLSMLEGDITMIQFFVECITSFHYYVLPEEEDPIFIKNSLARKWVFSGKICVFPLVTRETAKRNSVNRVAGTLKTKPIVSVKKDEKWPREDSRYPIFFQQDNARTNIPQNETVELQC